MLTINEINKVRKLYFEHNFSIAKVARIMHISRATAYKYINFVDMSVNIKVNSTRLKKIEAYREIVMSWIEHDRLHHIKQRHTAKRVYTRLKEEFPDFDCSMAMTQDLFRELKHAKSSMYNGYLPLTHKPGEAQVDLGDCAFYDNGVKVQGKYLVLTFPYSNASYCQLLYNKASESIVEGMRNIFEYLNGVPHTIWFDNDSALVRITHAPNIKRTYSEIFKRFHIHYSFKEVFMTPNKGNEKGSVEAGIRYVRRNLLVPIPKFDDIISFNKELLLNSTKLHDREHYISKESIADLHFEDLHSLNELPPVAFEPSTISVYKADNFGRVTINNLFYYLSPQLAFQKLQVKTTPREIEVFDINGVFIIKTSRLHGKNGTRYINWSPYIRLLANKPAALMHFSFIELFTDQNIIAKICNLNRSELPLFLVNFADMIDSVGISDAVARVKELL